MSKSNHEKLVRLIGRGVTFVCPAEDWERTGIIYGRYDGLAHLISRNGGKIEEFFVTGCPKIKKKKGNYVLEKSGREYGVNVYYPDGPTAEEYKIRDEELERVLG